MANPFAGMMQNWQQAGGMDALARNPLFNMGQSLAYNRPMMEGYVQSRQIGQMQDQEERDRKLREYFEKMLQKPNSTVGPYAGTYQMPQNPYAAMIPAMGQTPPTSPMPIPPPGAGGPAPGGAAPNAAYGMSYPAGAMPGKASAPSASTEGGADPYGRMLAAMGAYGDANQQAAAIEGMFQMRQPQKREMKQDQQGRWRYVDNGAPVFPNLPEGNVPRDADVLKLERGLYSDYRKESEEYESRSRNAQEAFTLLDEASASGDYGAMIKFIKTFDPTSVVREGEVYMYESFRPYVEQIQRLKQRVKGDEGALTPRARAEMKSALSEINKLNQENYQAFRNRWQERLEPDANLVNPQNIMGNPYRFPTNVMNYEMPAFPAETAGPLQTPEPTKPWLKYRNPQ